MNEDKISEAISRLFADGNRIVFWNDPDREFEESLTTLVLDGVTLLRADRMPGLEAKIRIEREQPDSRFLVYSTAEVPPASEDWLLDIRLYSETFRADRASIIHGELGLNEQLLRTHLAARAKFLGSKDRLARLKKFVQPTDYRPRSRPRNAGGADQGRSARILRHPDRFVSRHSRRTSRRVAGRVGGDREVRPVGVLLVVGAGEFRLRRGRPNAQGSADPPDGRRFRPFDHRDPRPRL